MQKRYIKVIITNIYNKFQLLNISFASVSDQQNLLNPSYTGSTENNMQLEGLYQYILKDALPENWSGSDLVVSIPSFGLICTFVLIFGFCLILVFVIDSYFKYFQSDVKNLNFLLLKGVTQNSTKVFFKDLQTRDDLLIHLNYYVTKGYRNVNKTVIFINTIIKFRYCQHLITLVYNTITQRWIWNARLI